jgi:hypothetical protein
MAAQRESSFLFSLKNWASQERLHAEAMERRTWERQRFAREMLEKKQAAEQELARLEREWQRDVAARDEALRLATLEKERVVAEAHARLEVLERQQAHERKLLAIREESRQRGTVQLAMAGFSLAAVVLLASGALYFGKLRPESERLSGAYDELVTAERTRARETARLLARADKRADDLDRELRRARKRIGELERAAKK